MDFDEFVDLYKDEYLKQYSGYLGISIKNWMYSDWMATYFPDEWHNILVDLERNLKEMFEDVE